MSWKPTFVNDNQAEGAQRNEAMCGCIKEDLVCRDDEPDILQNASPDNRIGPSFHIVAAGDDSGDHPGSLLLNDVVLLHCQGNRRSKEPDKLQSC